MGVQARIVLYASDPEAGRRAADEAFACIEAWEQVMSDWRPDSELSQLCAEATGEPRAASPELCAVLARSLELAAATDGAFDPTLGALVSLWREARGSAELPTGDVLRAARAHTGWERLWVDATRRVVALPPGMALDLGGIGKGWACDRALDRLRALGVTRALVDIGGDLAVGAPPPGRAGWRVAVDCPPQDDVVTVAWAGVATSGPTEQFVEIDDVRYSHVIDPRTGLGALRSACVSIVASDGATADALASAVSLLGSQRGRSVVRRCGARIVESDARDVESTHVLSVPTPTAR